MFKTGMRKISFALAFLVGGGAIGAAVTVPVMAYQVHMQNALSDLRAASNQLNMATPDKGGHRANAMGLVSQAISQVQMGINAGAQ